jgi:hypothetical protein
LKNQNTVASSAIS